MHPFQYFDAEPRFNSTFTRDAVNRSWLSINTTEFAPRDRASIPNEPVPENKSRNDLSLTSP